MFEQLYWNKWEKSTKYLYLSGLSLLLVIAGLFLYEYSLGNDRHLTWFITSEPETIDVKLLGFEKLFHAHELFHKNYLIYEKFVGSEAPANLNASVIFFGFIVLAAAMLLTAMSYVKEALWFYLGLSAVAIFIVFLRLDGVQLFGSNSSLTVLIPILLLAGAVFIIKSFFTALATVTRFFIFLGVIIGICVLYSSFSEIPLVGLYATNAGQSALAIVSLLFILLVSFEIVNSFFYISTRGKSANPSSNIWNFVAICVLYLGCLTMLYLEHKKIIQWNIKIVDPFVLLAISTIIGLWGHRNRVLRFQNVIPYKGGASLIYLAMAIICFGTIYYAFATSNDAFIHLYKKVVLYSHLFIGTTFFIYVLANFSPYFKTNKPIYKVVYEPSFLPLHFVRIGGVVIMVFIMAKSNLVVVDFWKSGYYNLWGDLYKAQSNEHAKDGNAYEAFENKNFAYLYYKNSYMQVNLCHKATYNLAKLEVEKFQKLGKHDHYVDAKKYYGYAIKSAYTTPQTFANYSELIWNNTHSSEDEREILLKGIAKFPDNGFLRNNLALTYRDMIVFRQDSVTYHLKKSFETTSSQFVPATNLVAFEAQYGNPMTGDSIYKANSGMDYVPLTINAMALKNRQGQPLGEALDTELMKDSVLSNESFFYLNNYITGNLETLDTSKINLSKYMNHEENTYLNKELVELDAHYQLNRGNKYDGKYSLVRLYEGALESKKSHYMTILGKYMLKEDNFKNAESWFTEATKIERLKFELNAQFYQGLTKAFLGKFNEAELLLNALTYADSLRQYATAGDVLNAVRSHLNDSIYPANDFQRLLYNSFKSKKFSDKFFNVYGSIQEPEIKAIAASQIIPNLIDNGYSEQALEILQTVPSMDYKTSTIELLNYAELRILEDQFEPQRLLEVLKEVSLSEPGKKYIPYFKAVAYEQQENYIQAEKYYLKAIQSSGFEENTFLKAIDFFLNKVKDYEKAYNIVLEAANSSPNSLSIRKAYIEVSIRNLYFDFAYTELNELSYIMEEYDFLLFKSKMDELKAKVTEEEINNF